MTIAQAFCLFLKSKDADFISETMGQLGIGEPSFSFKRKPVIIIIVGMSGIDLCSKIADAFVFSYLCIPDHILNIQIQI